MLESEYQLKLIKKLRRMFPGAIILKNDSSYQQGIPDLTILWGPYWALLEVKASKDAEQQANQEWFIDEASKMAFGAFIYPENEAEVLNALQRSFQNSWPARLSQR